VVRAVYDCGGRRGRGEGWDFESFGKSWKNFRLWNKNIAEMKISKQWEEVVGGIWIIIGVFCNIIQVVNG